MRMSLSSLKKMVSHHIVETKNGTSVNILKVTDVLEASKSDAFPEIMFGAIGDAPLYLIEGFLKYSNDEHVSDLVRSLDYGAKILVFVYPDTIIKSLKTCS